MGFIEGAARGQLILLPPTVDEYVAADAAVRVVAAFVAKLDMAALGFARAAPAREGRPGYDPRDLLQLYIYGYLNAIRSSRKLERECRRNLEVMWLLGGLAPDFKTIADFRRDNGAPIIATCRAFVQFCRARGVFAGSIAVIDGTKLRAVASRKRVMSAAEVAEAIARLDQAIAEHLAAMDAADAAEPDEASGERVKEALTALQAERGEIAELAARMTQEGRTLGVAGEAEARPMRQAGGGKPPAYNVQIAVDPASHMILHHAVTTDANDLRQLQPMAVAAKAVLGAERLTVVGDGGYANATQAAQCEAEHITPVVPPPAQVNRKGEYFAPTAFRYDAETDTMTCPAGRRLVRNGVHKASNSVRYRAESCAFCWLKPQCTGGERRHVYRLIDQPALDRMAARIAAAPELMRLRRCTVEHPFAALKHTLGGRLLLRGKVKAATETALAVLAYNLTRARNLLGHTALLAALA
jgi:transposase